MITSQFDTDFLSLTHQFNKKGPLLFSPQNASVPHQNTPHFNTENRKNLVWN